ncbi:MAG: AAA family ATPase [Acidobacteria bacterium]|nr:AAA family ATPase [Acidobacteriota bacterium]MYF14229.1 AAA family ATPase [Acidobacteriota bacterium]MYI96232.1 AAA family ATPase [Acidobacteriota bacterium]
MIQSLRISNFKCFGDAHLNGLGRFNVIVGRNGSGKTAFLEALFFLGSLGPELVLKIRRMRGLGQTISISDDYDHLKYLWRDFFLDFDENTEILLKSTGTTEHTRSLRIFCEPTAGATLPFGEQDVDDSFRSTTTTFVYELADGTRVECRPSLTKDGLLFDNRASKSFRSIFLTPVSREGPEHNAQRFSALSVRGKHGPIVSAIKREFPLIDDLSVEYQGGIPMVHAKLRAVSERVPVPLISDGINKMMSMLLAASTFPRGIVLVDEMENGLYFDTMRTVTKSVLNVAEKSGAQLFVTTHSHEYLEAILPLVQAKPGSFRLLRTTRSNGTTHIDMFDGKRFAVALKEGLEIR